MKAIISLLIFFSYIPFAFADSKDTTILIDAAALKKANPDKIMLDGKIDADIDHDNVMDVINYAYNASTPPAACSEENCIVQNNRLITQPTLTFDIFLKEPKASIQINYVCTSIGVMKSIHNGMKDIFCGPSSILRWNDEDYIKNN
ncbi:hypothetical protein [Commensalibacter papalotli (ex Servin-Garciduenas et al. 2014)]|uniref:Uncharacterized protein n=1 Tax=Commensalibacter papalotli (ex Servin-Garciduenas et al. 2014) TaxID=1208583 RepID=W7DYA1_9PROT|nr:hypothetical protein [Commensalibacter papalotli (ex Servin-Garciduenas et al. 2014)]EUK17619.1 hypothetical protein COMX_09176 [Commensalibacter papalotli (ex Servin-Garciduenas et al. 2014)]